METRPGTVMQPVKIFPPFNIGFLWLAAVKMFWRCKSHIYQISLLRFSVKSAAMDSRVFKTPAA